MCRGPSERRVPLASRHVRAHQQPARALEHPQVRGEARGLTRRRYPRPARIEGRDERVAPDLLLLEVVIVVEPFALVPQQTVYALAPLGRAPLPRPRGACAPRETHNL